MDIAETDQDSAETDPESQERRPGAAGDKLEELPLLVIGELLHHGPEGFYHRMRVAVLTCKTSAAHHTQKTSSTLTQA